MEVGRRQVDSRITKRRRLSWLTNSALAYEPKKMRGIGGGVAGSHSQPMKTWKQLYTWIQINFGDLHVTPYLNYSSAHVRGRGWGSVSRGDGKVRYGGVGVQYTVNSVQFLLLPAARAEINFMAERTLGGIRVAHWRVTNFQFTVSY